MRKLVIPLAAALVLAVAAGALAFTGTKESGTEGSKSEHDGWAERKQHALSSALAALVEDGTITQEQSDAIVSSLEALHAERLEERKAMWEQLEAFWEDGVLTSDEIDQLPHADRLKDPEGPLADALEDGELTKEELRGIGGNGKGFGHWKRHGHRHGRGWFKGWSKESPATGVVWSSA